MDNEIGVTSRFQNTLQRSVEYAGIGLHTGETVTLRMHPANENSGIVFRRIDLPEASPIRAHVSSVCDTSDRCTVLGNQACKIYTVEHLMAALYANQVDNVLIELSNIEPPVGNGSSDVFVDLIQEAGIEQQSIQKECLELTSPIYFSHGHTHLVAMPCDTFKVSYTLHYPQNPALKTQYCSFDITPPIFNQEIASCRTFCLYEEISALMDKGLIKGGSLDNAVVVHGKSFLSKNGLFFPDEPARHKILDVVGDLALLGYDLKMHIMAVRAGHAANYGLAQRIYNYGSSTAVRFKSDS